MTFPLDRLARQSALRQAQAEHLTGRLFINFIPTAIYDPVFCLKTTVDLALSLGLDPDNIVFEVVESEHIDDESHLKSIVDYYRGKGYRVALDDVGSGYSSLNLLVALKPDVIKVDLKIIRNIDRQPANQAVFRALAGIAAQTGARLLAEGATLAQGFFWGNPRRIPTSTRSSVPGSAPPRRSRAPRQSTGSAGRFFRSSVLRRGTLRSPGFRSSKISMTCSMRSITWKVRPLRM